LPADAKRSNEASLFSAFISHAKPDVKKAQAIAAALEERGFKCWIAPRDVRPGRSYGDEIIRGIEKSRSFVLILSEASNDSAFVAREVERAVSKNKPVFPIRIADVAPSPALELFISSTQWIDAFPGERLSSQIDQLATYLAEEGSEEGVEAIRKPPPPSPRRRSYAMPAVLVVGGILTLAAGGLLWQTMRHVEPDPAADADFQACETGSGEASIAACERAIAGGLYTGHNLSLLYNDRGYMRMMKGELDPALADFEVAMRLDPKNYFAYWNRGAVYAAKGDVDRAKADYQMALALNPDADSRKKIEAALASLGPASRTAPPSADTSADVDFDGCVKLTGDEQLAACDRAIASGKFDGANLASLYGLRGGAQETSDPDAALSDYNESLRLDPSRSVNFAGRAFTYMKKGDFDRAISDFTEAVRLDPNNFPAYAGRGRAYLQKGAIAEARADFEKTLTFNPAPDIKTAVEAALNALPATDPPAAASKQ
jgi:tetratricopeptide (TPR) repeat protein